MTNEEKLKVARDALLRLSREHDCGCSFPCRCNGEEWDRINTEGLRDIAIEALAIIDASSAEQPDLHSIRLETAKQEIKYWKAKATAPSAEQPADVPEVARARAEEVAELAAQLVTMTAEIGRAHV